MKVVLEHVTKRFPNRNKKIKEDVIAVNDFNFEIPDGKLIGLLGPSGCGKSTALNLICGLEKPTEGRIIFGDTDVTELSPMHRGVGLVFQNYALYPHLTVRENIRFPLENFRGDKKLSKEEMEAKWITGQEELTEDAWNAYVAQLEAFGLSRAIQYKQAAYDAFMNN